LPAFSANFFNRESKPMIVQVSAVKFIVLLPKNYHTREDFFSPQRPQSAQSLPCAGQGKIFVFFVPFVVKF